MSTDDTLLARARRFDKAALAEIYDRFSPGLYRYAVRLLGDADQAEDCVAETFSRFLHAVHRGGGPRQHLRAYLYRVAHNWITDTYRRQPPPPLPLKPNLKADSQEDPARALRTRMQAEAARAALHRLTPDQRQVIVLKFLQDWSNREIAEVLEKSVGAVKGLQHRGLAALQRLLIDDEEAGT